MIALLVVFVIIITAFTSNSNTQLQEGATGSSSSQTMLNSTSGASGNTYTMVNTVTEPDGTVVTDTLDTEGNYVTTVYTTNTMNANQQPPNTETTKQPSSFTEIKQPRVTFDE